MPSKKSNETQEEELEQQQSQSENDLALRTPDEHLEMLAAARQMKQSTMALAQSSSRVDVGMEMWTEPPVSEEEALEQDKRAWAQRKEKALRSTASRKSTEP